MSQAVKKVLIFTMAAGSGHQSIATSLADLIKSNNSRCKIAIINVNPKITELIYRYAGNLSISGYNNIWEWANLRKNSQLLIKLIYPLLLKTVIQPSIEQFQPSLIISSDPISIYPTSKYLQTNELTIPHVVYITDPFTIHSLWATKPCANLYLVATKDTTITVERLGVPSDRIVAIGWLLRKEFYTQKKILPSNDKVNLFIGGSGDGGGNIIKVIKLLAKDPLIVSSASLTVVCGKNKLLLLQLYAYLLTRHFPYKIIGYTKNIKKYLEESDLVIGKPGPNLLFESIYLHKPFIATGEPLAQELGSYEYIDRKKIGYSTTHPRITHEKIRYLIENKEVISNMVKRLEILQANLNHSRQKTWDALGKFLK